MFKFWSALASLIVAANLAPAVAAQPLSDGNGYYSLCVTSDGLKDICYGYFMGIADAPVINNGTKADDAAFCQPPASTYQQNMDVFHAFLRANPRLRTIRTSLLFAMAMNDAFPCASSPYFTPDLEHGGVFVSKPMPRGGKE